jgi:hypothetical protein
VPYAKGDVVLYTTRTGDLTPAQIVSVHHETAPPYYTILSEGNERQTEAHRLRPAPPPLPAAPPSEEAARVTARDEQPRRASLAGSFARSAADGQRSADGRRILRIAPRTVPLAYSVTAGGTSVTASSKDMGEGGRQWAALGVMGGRKKARCAECTRPLAEEEIESASLLCQRCAGGANVGGANVGGAAGNSAVGRTEPCASAAIGAPPIDPHGPCSSIAPAASSPSQQQAAALRTAQGVVAPEAPKGKAARRPVGVYQPPPRRRSA